MSLLVFQGHGLAATYTACLHLSSVTTPVQTASPCPMHTPATDTVVDLGALLDCPKCASDCSMSQLMIAAPQGSSPWLERLVEARNPFVPTPPSVLAEPLFRPPIFSLS